MPVRSLNSCVLRWLDRNEVDRVMRLWTAEQVRVRSEIVRLGYFGSYARDDWEVAASKSLLTPDIDINTGWMSFSRCLYLSSVYQFQAKARFILPGRAYFFPIRSQAADQGLEPQ